MNGMYRWVCIRVTAAEPMLILSRLAEYGVAVRNVVTQDPITVELEVPANRYEQLKSLLSAWGVECVTLKRLGWLWRVAALFKRPVLVGGLALFLTLTLLLPNRIFFVRIEGNEALPDKYLLTQAAQCGVAFGSKRREVRSEKVKNALLAAVPELQWVGINTSGCVATVHVRERSLALQKEERNGSVSSIVASGSGVISSITVTTGTPKCYVGQQVDAGDLLISGYTDCGRKLRAEHAAGEVYAYTLRTQSLVVPAAAYHKGAAQAEHVSFSVRIGKKLLNFCNDSGIHGGSCDKMYKEYTLTLPGGFRLPVSLIRRSCTVHQRQYQTDGSAEDYDWVYEQAKTNLLDSMIAGNILSYEQNLQLEEDRCLLLGSYACNEMIGKVKYEEILSTHAEDS